MQNRLSFNVIYLSMRLLLVIFLLSFQKLSAQYAEKVNPFIGTGGHGHTFPGPTMPFGGCQVGPDTRIDGSWDGCSGYHYSDSVIYGFSHTHLSGTGVSDWGDILLMPTTEKSELDEYQYAQTFSHNDEIAEAGYYSVLLDNKVKVELTPTLHGAMHRYQYGNEATPYVILNLEHRDEVLDTEVEIVDDYTLRGYRFSKAWAQNQKVFFEITFDQPIQEIEYRASKKQSGDIAPNKHQLLRIRFAKAQNKKAPHQYIKVKAAISGVDVEGAHKNLEAEMPDWDFEKLKKQAQKAWNDELSKIQIESKSPVQDTIFYTALYHCMIHPSIYSDVDGRYRGRDDQIHSTEGKFDYYTVFSLWDTYRALHPLLSVLDRERTKHFILTFLRQYQEGGRLPMWELSSNETNCMIGYHAVSVIWDAYSKKIKNFDTTLALEAMVSIANENILGKEAYREKNYISVEDESESVSKTLEYSYDDWCIAQMARSMGQDSIADEFERRSSNAKNLFNWKTGLYEPRNNGKFIPNYDPTQVNNYYTEGNAWQYMRGNHLNDTMYYTQGIKTRKVDEIFTTTSKLSGRTQVDVTGLIGQYAHGNEPSHHLAFMIEDDSLRQQTIDYIYYNFYTNTPDGLIGNEDCGQMSAWYVWATLGMYPVVPGSLIYETAHPQVRSAEVYESVKYNSYFRVEPDSPAQYTYHTAIYTPISHDVMHHFGYVYIPKGKYSAFNEAYKPSVKDYAVYLPPTISVQDQTFRDSTLVSMESAGSSQIYFSIDNGPIRKYKSPFYVKKSCEINAGLYEISDDQKPRLRSALAHSSVHLIDNNYEAELISIPNPQYTAGGPTALIDGLYGDLDWRKGRWIGVQGEPLELIIDLHEVKTINRIKPHFLSDQRSWIFFPSSVQIYTSLDAEKWILADKWQSTLGDEVVENSLEFISLSPHTETSARYIKVIAEQFGALPNWHPGRGGESFIFVDEVVVE